MHVWHILPRGIPCRHVGGVVISFDCQGVSLLDYVFCSEQWLLGALVV